MRPYLHFTLCLEWGVIFQATPCSSWRVYMVPCHLKTMWFLVFILPDGLVTHLVSECDLEWPTRQGSQSSQLESIYFSEHVALATT